MATIITPFGLKRVNCFFELLVLSGDPLANSAPPELVRFPFPVFAAPLAVLTVPTAFGLIYKGRFDEACMILYTAQEFLGVLLVVAISMGTVLILGVLFILCQEGIRRAVRWAKTGAMPPEGLSPQRTDGRPALR